MENIATPWMWAGFFAFAVIATVVDLRVLAAPIAASVVASRARRLPKKA